jgi:hypothetical protein
MGHLDCKRKSRVDLTRFFIKAMGRCDRYMEILERALAKREEVRTLSDLIQNRNKILLEDAFRYLRKIEKLQAELMTIKNTK